MKPSTARGLAVSAVSALTLTGLSVATAPLASAAGPDVELLSQFTGYASTAFNGNLGSSPSRLTAYLQSPDAVVSFQVNPDPEAGDADAGWRDVSGTTQYTGDYAYVTWGGGDSTGRSYTGERVALRVVATDAGGTSYATRNDVEVTGMGNEVPSVSITTLSAPFFTQPYADSGRTSTTGLVSGATSTTSGTVELSTWRGSDGTFVGQTQAQVESASFKIPGLNDEYLYFGRFTGALELSAFDLEQGVVGVAAELGSDDVAPVSLTPQTITSIDAYYAQDVRPGDQGDVTVRVSDENGRPVIGAEVRRVSNGALVGYTDRDGSLVTTQAGGSTEQYYANATDVDAYDSTDGDVQSGEVTVGTYEPVAAYTDGLLADGAVFDVDEYAAGDLAVRVLDDQGRRVGAGESVSYKIYPSDEEPPAVYSTALTNDDGVAVVDFDATGASGAYTFVSVLTSRVGTDADQVQSFTTGEAALLLSPKADPVVEEAGGQVDYFGRLVVEGEPLAGRRVDLAYDRGVEVVPGNRADAAILTADGRSLGTTVTTNANGSFRVTVDDKDENPLASETGGVLSAVTGDTVATETSTIDGNAATDAVSTTQFGTAGPGAAEISLSGFGNGPRADRLRVSGPAGLAGEGIKAFRVTAKGRRVLVSTETLNRKGDRSIRVADRNRRATTTYVVRLVASPRVAAAFSNTRVLR